jgi:hypothetical protein
MLLLVWAMYDKVARVPTEFLADVCLNKRLKVFSFLLRFKKCFISGDVWDETNYAILRRRGIWEAPQTIKLYIEQIKMLGWAWTTKDGGLHLRSITAIAGDYSPNPHYVKIRIRRNFTEVLEALNITQNRNFQAYRVRKEMSSTKHNATCQVVRKSNLMDKSVVTYTTMPKWECSLSAKGCAEMFGSTSIGTGFNILRRAMQNGYILIKNREAIEDFDYDIKKGKKDEPCYKIVKHDDKYRLLRQLANEILPTNRVPHIIKQPTYTSEQLLLIKLGLFDLI